MSRKALQRIVQYETYRADPSQDSVGYGNLLNIVDIAFGSGCKHSSSLDLSPMSTNQLNIWVSSTQMSLGEQALLRFIISALTKRRLVQYIEYNVQQVKRGCRLSNLPASINIELYPANSLHSNIS